MSAVQIQGNASGTGTLTIAAPNTNTNQTLTLPDQTGTFMVNGPAFSAYQSSAQTLSSSTATKLQFQTEEFDTANAFNNTGSTIGTAPAYSFNPQIAGYYQINGCVQIATTNTTVYSAIYKNATQYKIGNAGQALSASNVSSIVYLNGTTDYVELYGYFAIGQNVATGISLTYFNGAMVRSA